MTKGGTNDLHGTAFWFVRNDILQAADFFTNKIGGTKNKLRWNQYGLTAGGPVRRDQTFFFYSWEGHKRREPQVVTALVPTAAQRATVVDPLARGILQYYPQPTDPNAPAGSPNFVGNVPRAADDNTHLARIDHNLGAHDRLMGRYLWFGGKTITPGALPNTGGNSNTPGAQSLAISESHLFSPSFFVEIRAGYSRNKTDFKPQDFGFNAASIFPGVPGVVDTTRDGGVNSGLPRVTIAGGFAPLGSATNLPQGRVTSTYELLTTATGIAPLGFTRHTLKLGYAGRREDARRFLNGNSRGALGFANFAAYAGACADCGGRSLLNSSTIRTGETLAFWYRYPHALYVQDDVKVKPNLTLNFGLRYEIPSVFSEKRGNGSNFIEGVGPILIGTNRLLDLDPSRRGRDAFIYRDAPITLPASGALGDRNNFAPVFGFAYTPRFGPGPLGDEKTVIRGGFRVAYDDIFNNIPVNQALNAPRVLTTTQRAGTTQPASGYRWEVAFDQNVPLVARTTQAPGAPALGLIAFNAYDYRARSAYAYNWNFGIERLIHGVGSIDVSYLGSAGHKLGMFVDLNEPGVIVRDAGFRGVQAPNEQVFPYRQWGGVGNATFQGNSIYNGLVVSAKIRARNSLTMNTSYTFGHGIDDNSSFFGSDDDFGVPATRRRLDLERSNSGNDQRHRFVNLFVWDLPLGRGRRWLSSAPALVEHTLGGWSLAGITNASTGHPFTVYANTALDFSGFNQFVDRPNVVAGGPLAIHRDNPDNFFDPAYFGKTGTGICPGYAAASTVRVTGGCATVGAVGSSPRNGYYGPGLVSFDMTVSKRFPLGDRVKLEYRAEFFNLFNHTNFSLRVDNRTMSAVQFGMLGVTSEQIFGGPRVIQMTLRLLW